MSGWPELERLNQAPAQATFVAGTNGDIRNYGAGPRPGQLG